jgi:hypothetical protein
VLWSPGDWREIPVSQQKSLGSDLKSFDPKELAAGGAHSKIEAIFSNNGGTWDRLNALASGSTLMGSGFYMKKSEEGKWVLLLGAVKKKSVDDPPYALWKVLDTKNLAALDFDGIAAEVLRAIVCFSRRPNIDEWLNDEDLKRLLEDLHTLSCEVSGTVSSQESAEEYLLYLVRESIACKHVNEIMDSIGKDTHSSGYTVKEALLPQRLEEDLQVPAGSYSTPDLVCTSYTQVCVRVCACIVHIDARHVT